MAQSYNANAPATARRSTAQAFLKDRSRREPATVARARKYGMANQIEYEQNSRIERQDRLKQMATSKAAVQDKAATKKKKADTGMNAGTMGGARSLRNAFFR